MSIIQQNGKNRVVLSLMEISALVAILLGILSIIGTVTVWVILPYRVGQLETVNTRQDGDMKEIVIKAAASNELLARIDERTKRIEAKLP